MSRVTRIVLASLVSLAVIIGIYSSVEGASLSARQDKAGTHLVSGSAVNLDHYRAAESYQSQMQIEQKGHSGGCGDEARTSPDD